MLKAKERNFKTCLVSLDNLVPKDNFYRDVEAKLDLSFVRELVQDCYSSNMGRPSIDPGVFFKLQLIMFFEGIRSERQLMEMVNLNLAFRWFIGYDLDEQVPNHSALSKIRDRYGLEVFQRFFEKVVELCIEAGLVWGKELYFDGTKVQANASKKGLVPRWYWEAQTHLDDLFDTATEQMKPVATRLIEKYDGTRLTTSVRKPTYNRKTDLCVNPYDPDASPMSRFTGDVAKMGYHTHYVVDGGKSRIILASLVTPASIMDNQPMLDLVRWVRFRWRLKPDIAVGDTKYGTIYNIIGLEQDGVKAYLPRTDLSRRNGFYPPESFTYNAERDEFICPEGNTLPLWSKRASEQTYVYRADAKICNVCPVKAKCTDSKSGRHLRRSFYQDNLDRANSYRSTEAYKKAINKRKVWVEPLFGEAKQWHNLRKFRLKRLRTVNIEGLLTATGQNIKRLLKQTTRKFTPDSAYEAALPISVQHSSI